MIIMFKVIKMVTNPKTYLACSLKGLYRKADSFRKDIIVHKNITITITTITKAPYIHNQHQRSASSLKTFRNVTIITFTLLAIVSSGTLVFNKVNI